MLDKVLGFCLIECDENEDVLVTFTYPTCSADEKAAIRQGGQILAASGTYSLVSSWKDDYLYIEGAANPQKGQQVKLFAVCLIVKEFHQPFFSTYAKVLSSVWVASANPPKVLRAFLAAEVDGELSHGEIEFSVGQFNVDEPVAANALDVLVDRVQASLPVLWQAVITGKSVAISASDISVLQAAVQGVVAIARPGKRAVSPITIDLDSASSVIQCTLEGGVMQHGFDFVLDLTGKSHTVGPQFRDAGKGPLLEKLTAALGQGNALALFPQFNRQVIALLAQIREREGEVGPGVIAGLNLPPETKLLLNGVVAAGVLAF